ncbi:MAG: PilZ domain-containing protein [Gammaproteobacteria bacterium]|nr:PilZ domain-containing protein [Gammaproteobacteria bacterium]
MQSRKFTRYPTDFSVSLVIDHMAGKHQLFLKDASQGGLCLNARGCINCGTHLDIKFPTSKPFNTQGKITWCKPSDTGQCLVGIEFEEKLALSTIERMVLRH